MGASFGDSPFGVPDQGPSAQRCDRRGSESPTRGIIVRNSLQSDSALGDENRGCGCMETNETPALRGMITRTYIVTSHKYSVPNIVLI